MKIGVLGAGSIGGTLGRLWRKAGHEVRFGTRHPEQLVELVAETGAGAGSVADAASFGEVVLIAVPLKAIPELASEVASALTGKVVVDANNAYSERDGRVAATATSYAGGSSAWVAAHLPGSRVVKAFNTVYFKTLQEKAHNAPLGIPLAGDDRTAMAMVERLVRDAGFVPVVVGDLASGKRFEPGTAVYNTGIEAGPLAEALGVGGHAHKHA